MTDVLLAGANEWSLPGPIAGDTWGPYRLARTLLAEVLPRRWQHSLGVGARAVSLAPLLGDNDGRLLHVAALLHDIGYAPQLAVTGFHAIDGARYLREAPGIDDRIVRLVAHHSCAAIEAEERGLVEAMNEFEPASCVLTEALIWCDMRTSPDGELVDVRARIADIVERYGRAGPVARFIVRAGPLLIEATESVDDRLTIGDFAQPM